MRITEKLITDLRPLNSIPAGAFMNTNTIFIQA